MHSVTAESRSARRIGARCLAAGALLVSLGGAAIGMDIRFRTAPEFSTGRYGTETRTDVYSVPMEVALEMAPVTLALRVPYLSITGPGGFVPREGDLRGTGARRETVSGLGDLRATLTYNLIKGSDEPASPSLDLALQTRFPTATDRSLGSGQIEHIARIATDIPLSQSVTIDAALGRRFVVAPRAGGAGRDYWTLSSNIAWDITAATTIGAGAYAQDRVPDAPRRVLEVGAFLDHQVAPGVVAGVFLWHGLTRESADWTLGFRLAYRGSL